MIKKKKQWDDIKKTKKMQWVLLNLIYRQKSVVMKMNLEDQESDLVLVGMDEMIDGLSKAEEVRMEVSLGVRRHHLGQAMGSTYTQDRH